jgi:hypothetical protein
MPIQLLGDTAFSEVVCTLRITRRKMGLKRRPEPPRRSPPLMVHDLVLAAVFLDMIITPALLAMRSEREEKDVL